MSEIIRVRRLDIAVEYLDAAMQMYLGRRYFSAIHLAGAAAEIFDAHLPQGARTSEIAWKAQKALCQSELGLSLPSKKQTNEVVNGPRNAIKHMADGDLTVAIDPISEADWWIDNALISSKKLNLITTQTAWKYQDLRARSCMPFGAAPRDVSNRMPE